MILICLGINYYLCSFEFKVKGDSGARILLSNCENCHGYEIVIGGWDNSQSAIRDGKQKETNQFLTSTPNILSQTEFRQFWVKIIKGDKIMISVGKGGENQPFMTTTFNKKKSILYVAFASQVDGNNEWNVNIKEGT